VLRLVLNRAGLVGQAALVGEDQQLVSAAGVRLGRGELGEEPDEPVALG
jgi:hypothetical protein